MLFRTSSGYDKCPEGVMQQFFLRISKHAASLGVSHQGLEFTVNQHYPKRAIFKDLPKLKLTLEKLFLSLLQIRDIAVGADKPLVFPIGKKREYSYDRSSTGLLF